MGRDNASAPINAPIATQISITTISGTCSQTSSELKRTGTGVVFFSANHNTSRKKPSLSNHAASLMRRALCLSNDFIVGNAGEKKAAAIAAVVQIVRLFVQFPVAS